MVEQFVIRNGNKNFYKRVKRKGKGIHDHSVTNDEI